MIDDPEQPEWFNKLMRSQQSESEPPVRVQPVVRPRTKPCNCSHKKEKAWGYKVFKWMKRSPFWKPVGESSSLLVAYDIADKYDHVLIVCQGCGAEMLREYGPNDQADRPEAKI